MNLDSIKTTITQEEYLTLIGVLTLVHNFNSKIKDLEKIAAKILKQSDQGYGYFGHISDAMYDDKFDVDNLLQRMNITVEK